MEETTIAHENPAGMTLGAVIGSAIVAALVAFFLRRAMRSRQEEVEIEMSTSAIKERAAAATGEFLRSYVAPEMKPMLLSVLKDVKDYVERGFDRAESSIKSF